jgi:hypothetical protein
MNPSAPVTIAVFIIRNTNQCQILKEVKLNPCAAGYRHRTHREMSLGYPSNSANKIYNSVYRRIMLNLQSNSGNPTTTVLNREGLEYLRACIKPIIIKIL